MHFSWHKTALPALLVVMVGGVFVVMNLSQPVFGVVQQPNAGAAPRYTVVSSEGTNLIVTDNKSSTLFFYTIDKEAEPGADLKLRGSVDLRNVGREILKPKLYRKK